MNHRVVVIVLLAFFTACFVGSGAIAVNSLLNAAVSAWTRDQVSSPTPKAEPSDEPSESAEPSEPPEVPSEDVAAAEPSVTPDEPPPEGDPADTDAEFEAPLQGTAEFAVFHVDKAKLDPWVALQKVAKGTKVKVFKGDAPVSAIPPYLELRDLSVTDYAVIGGQTLENGRGLTPAVKLALPGAKRVSVVDAVLPLGGAPLLEVSKVMAAFAQATGGVLWDEEGQEYLALEAWKARRVDTWEKNLPWVSMNVTVFFEAVDDGVDLRTAGLKHFGLPELELKGLSAESQDSGVALLNAAAQVLAEGKPRPGPGPLTISLAAIHHAQHRKSVEARALPNAKRAVNVVLVPGSSLKVPTLAVTFEGTGPAAARAEAGLVELFGSAD